MSERAQALEHLQRLARDIGDVRDVAGRRSDPPREHQQMLARLGQWRGGILTVIDILQAPAEGVSPQPDTRRDCTCLGTCKGADGLSPRYRCALQHPAHVGPYCSYSAPVSPVEPTPEPPTNPACKRCGHPLSAHRPEFGVCDGSTRPCACPEFVLPTGEPAPCVWVADGEGYLRPGCTDAHLWGDYVETTEGWQCCPYCEAPLTVER